MSHWVTIKGRHVLIEEDGGHDGTHDPAKETGNKTSDTAVKLELQPAVIVNGKTITGSSHVSAVDSAAKKFGISQQNIWDKVTAEGFVTNSGKFVNRRTASTMVGWKNSQLRADDLRVLQMPLAYFHKG